MREHGIIFGPVMSEKAFKQAAEKQYSFFVNKKSTASEIAYAIEKIFKVDVDSVRTLNQLGKKTKTRGISGERISVKKAIVSLKPGQRIAGFEVEEAKPVKDEKPSKEKVKENKDAKSKD